MLGGAHSFLNPRLLGTRLSSRERERDSYKPYGKPVDTLVSPKISLPLVASYHLVIRAPSTGRAMRTHIEEK